MASSPLEDKVAIFNTLDGMNSDTDDDDDRFREEQELRKKSRAFFARTGAQERRPLGLSDRSASAPTPISRNPQRNITESRPLTANKDAYPRPLEGLPSTQESRAEDPKRGGHSMPRRRTTNPLSSAIQSPASHPYPTIEPTTRKRKHPSSKKAVPEPDQIFQGLSFYYIPNNDVARARKLRIDKAREHGATWVRILDDATHVIVDKKLIWKDIESILSSVAELDSLVVVNEEYPLDCIGFRQICSPDQYRYRISGRPQPESHTLPVSRDDSSGLNESLQLKAAPRNYPEKRNSVPSRGTSPAVENISSETGLGSQSQRNKESSPQGAVVQSSHGVASEDNDGRTSNPARQGHVTPSNPNFRDELGECIEMMQKARNLPLDQEEDENVSSVGTGDEAGSDSEDSSRDERARKRRPSGMHSRPNQKDTAWKDKFACNQGGTLDDDSESANPNARTIEILRAMCDHYSRIQDQWRTMAYRRAVNVLRQQTTKISTREQASKLPTIGERLAQKIEEIVTTDRLQRLEYAQAEPTDRTLQTFLKIYGVGTSQANKWISQGFQTLEDLSAKAKLTPNQRLGIEHYEDLNTRIPRQEVKALGEYVIKTAAAVDPAVELLVGGSYRRGSKSSGDIDLIVTKKGTSSTADLVPFLEDLVSQLTKQGFLTATLAALSSHRSGKDGPGSKWHGCCVLPRTGDDDSKPIWRRIDFLLVPETEYGAALIYFTGNDIFNRSMRLLASKQGMRLNQRGLYKEVMRGPGRVKVTEGKLVEGRDEKKIFEVLGVQWREPWERWC